jgi:hypothetical protein
VVPPAVNFFGKGSWILEERIVVDSFGEMGFNIELNLPELGTGGLAHVRGELQVVFVLPASRLGLWEPNLSPAERFGLGVIGFPQIFSLD